MCKTWGDEILKPQNICGGVAGWARERSHPEASSAAGEIHLFHAESIIWNHQIVDSIITICFLSKPICLLVKSFKSKSKWTNPNFLYFSIIQSGFVQSHKSHKFRSSVKQHSSPASNKACISTSEGRANFTRSWPGHSDSWMRLRQKSSHIKPLIKAQTAMFN